MIDILKNVFTEEQLLLCEALPFYECSVLYPHKLARLGFVPESVIVFAIPYFVKDETERNLSRYAVPRDYHLYVKELEKRLIPSLEMRFQGHHFSLFADNSPIDERSAAVKAGLGVAGKNGLVLTERYGSYVFLGEVLTDLCYDEIGTRQSFEITPCHACGACLAACPKKKECLSALTQRKGVLSEDEEKEIVALGLVWGCDVCQEVCPYNRSIEETPIAFFQKERIPYLTRLSLEKMSDEEFSRRAYAWRKRETVLRNLRLFDDFS